MSMGMEMFERYILERNEEGRRENKQSQENKKTGREGSRGGR